MGVSQVTPEPCEECGKEIDSLLSHEDSCPAGRASAKHHIKMMKETAGTDAHLPAFSDLVKKLSRKYGFTDEYGNPEVSL